MGEKETVGRGAIVLNIGVKSGREDGNKEPAGERHPRTALTAGCPRCIAIPPRQEHLSQQPMPSAAAGDVAEDVHARSSTSIGASGLHVDQQRVDLVCYGRRL